MSMARRTALIAWARQNKAWVIEDDYDSELRYAGHPFPSLQGLDPTRVVYLGTFSKVLFPSLRLGYLIAPTVLIDTFLGARALMDRHSPTADQHALAAWMAHGHFEAHIRRIRGVYAERRAALLSAITKHLSDLVTVLPSDQGTHVVVWLLPGTDDVAVAAHAHSAGLTVRPISPMYRGTLARSGLMLGFGGFAAAQLDTAAVRLRQVLLAIAVI